MLYVTTCGKNKSPKSGALIAVCSEALTVKSSRILQAIEVASTSNEPETVLSIDLAEKSAVKLIIPGNERSPPNRGTLTS